MSPVRLVILLVAGALLVLSACSVGASPEQRDSYGPVDGLPPVGALGGTGLAVTTTGEVYAWGPHTSGQVGDAEVENCGDLFNSRPCQPRPTRIRLPVPAVAVSAGGDHALARGADGTVWTWGAEHRPGAGNGPDCATENSDAPPAARPRCHAVPIRVDGLPPATAISAGQRTDVALDAQGRVWVWGAAIDGPERCPGGIGANGGVFACVVRPRPMAGLPPVASLTVAPTGEIYAVDTAGGVWWWGTGYPGPYPFGTAAYAVPRRLGVPVPVRAVAASADTEVAVGRDGSAWVWGRLNARDRPRCPDRGGCVIVPISSLPSGTVSDLVPGGSLRVRTVDGRELSYGSLPSEGWSTPRPGDPPIPQDPPMDGAWFIEPPIPRAVQVLAGTDYAGRVAPAATVLLDDGGVLARGDNRYGQLGP